VLELVPLRIRSRREPEVAGQIHNLEAGVEQRGSQERAGPVGKREECEGRPVGPRSGIERSQHPATHGRSGEVRMDLRQRAARRLVRRQIPELHVGMLRQQPHELAPHIARRTEDCDAQTAGLNHAAYLSTGCMNMSTDGHASEEASRISFENLREDVPSSIPSLDQRVGWSGTEVRCEHWV
jgi:hypothetical protein